MNAVKFISIRIADRFPTIAADRFPIPIGSVPGVEFKLLELFEPFEPLVEYIIFVL